ncbi:MAG: DUF3883 domain-containing protein [Chlorobi bacterium]|nr:DUF3883 domain-containing protein [Chlorobiota bacterium]
MAKLEDIRPTITLGGILPDCLVTVSSVQWFGTEALELLYKDPSGKLGNELLYRHDEARIQVIEHGRPWSFDADGHLFRVVSEAHRIRLAHLFDPLLAVHTSDIRPLPHQITAVYQEMLPRQPLRFLLADDPGAGKTIMAGLLIKELIARSDLQRCLIVCPGNLAEQWQDELYRKFNLPFEILTNDKLETARTGNWFVENNLVIARLDKLSRSEDVQAKLAAPDGGWDLVVCDEAHKMSATFFGGEVKYTKRYKLGQLLSQITRHFLLMTATPHNGKEEDFQLFMALIDADRFEGRFRDEAHTADVSDLMRRMVKEHLLTFDATPLFPERLAYTIPYKLSPMEEQLYTEVTHYVNEEFNRAEATQNERRAGTVGFALTILQRRLASSPEAIYLSLRRRRERLEAQLRQHTEAQRTAANRASLHQNDLLLDPKEIDPEEIENLEDAPDGEVEAVEETILNQATAARTIAELQAEIATLARLESLARRVQHSGEDKKWQELRGLLQTIFSPPAIAQRIGEGSPLYSAGPERAPKPSPLQKLVIFTEHRDTLNYLHNKIATVLGRPKSVVCIHGAMGRQARLQVQEVFKHDPEVQVLLATDAAGEGINLQRAHLMVNYDLPWNPNRIEQRFGRIHRIGQTEVCHLWNLVAAQTREGEVYRTLLTKLEEARQTLGGQVFDILGKLEFDGHSLRDLLLEAIRYGELPETKARLQRVVSSTFNREKLERLLQERALVHNLLGADRIHTIREDMERAEARRLQPHYIQSFFLEAFERLHGTIRQREPQRFEITHVPVAVRQHGQLNNIGGQPVLQRYERITFQKELIEPHDAPPAAFISPGHPLLNATLDLIYHNHRDLLRNGTVLVDTSDPTTQPRMLFYLEHSLQDASLTRNGQRRIISTRMLYVEMDPAGNASHIQYAPYLDYRPLQSTEPTPAQILQRPECAWITHDLEHQVQNYAVATVVQAHYQEIYAQKIRLIAKTKAAVQERLTKEIAHWDRRAQDLKAQEQSGILNTRLNSNEARKRADTLQARRQKRMEELELEAKISPLPPVVIGGLLVVPIGLLAAMDPAATPTIPTFPRDTQAAAARARNAVMEVERALGYDPVDRETEKLGYDIESRVPGTGQLRFIEVKGRAAGAETITVTKNEILYFLNKPDDVILAIVEFLDESSHKVHYIRRPFLREPDFGVVAVNYSFAELLARATPPE